jgi:hypothetical protein
MPPSLAAGVIAFVLQHTETSYPDIGIERIASVCDISEGTLNKCLKKLESKYEQLKKVMVFEKKESL